MQPIKLGSEVAPVGGQYPSGAMAERNWAESCQIVDNSQESWEDEQNRGWSQTMEQLDRDDPSHIARRLFKELCALYPDRYIALIEQPPLSPAVANAKALAAPQKPITL
jgi:hypothetical protein